VDDAAAMKDNVELAAAIYPATLAGQRGGCVAISAYPQGVIGPPLREYLEFLEFLRCLAGRPPRSR